MSHENVTIELSYAELNAIYKACSTYENILEFAFASLEDRKYLHNAILKVLETDFYYHLKDY